MDRNEALQPWNVHLNIVSPKTSIAMQSQHWNCRRIDIEWCSYKPWWLLIWRSYLLFHLNLFLQFSNGQMRSRAFRFWWPSMCRWWPSLEWNSIPHPSSSHLHWQPQCNEKWEKVYNSWSKGSQIAVKLSFYILFGGLRESDWKHRASDGYRTAAGDTPTHLKGLGCSGCTSAMCFCTLVREVKYSPQTEHWCVWFFSLCSCSMCALRFQNVE